jgi:hypothetical protein
MTFVPRRKHPWASTACYGDSFTVFLYLHHIFLRFHFNIIVPYACRPSLWHLLPRISCRKPVHARLFSCCLLLLAVSSVSTRNEARARTPLGLHPRLLRLRCGGELAVVSIWHRDAASVPARAQRLAILVHMWRHAVLGLSHYWFTCGDKQCKDYRIIEESRLLGCNAVWLL